MACGVLAEVLYGGGKGGTYQYDQKLKLSAKATDGMVGDRRGPLWVPGIRNFLVWTALGGVNKRLSTLASAS